MTNEVKKMVEKPKQMSETLILSFFLAFSGGFQDAYTYVVRSHVFANAQTGNVVLMSSNFFNGNWENGIKYLFPLISFMLGVIVAENISHFFKSSSLIHWRQGVVLIEIAIMISVGFIPQELNFLANGLVSFACAMQLQTFRTVGGNNYASTMCIGNLRSGTASLSVFLRTRDLIELKKGLFYFGIIVIFAIGAGVGAKLSSIFNEYTIWFTCVALLCCFLLMQCGRRDQKLSI